MIDDRELFERAAQRFDPPRDSFERFTRRQHRRRRNQRIGAAIVAIVVAALLFGGIARAIVTADQEQPVTPPSTDIFARVHGWIAVGTSKGIEAIDPDDPQSSIHLSKEVCNPIGWSRDGRQLLCTTEPEPGGVSVLRADGTVVRLRIPSAATPGSFTQDGSEVLFTANYGLYAVDIATGAKRSIAVGYPLAGTGFEGSPQLSPDGTTIAVGRTTGRSQGIWLMNADGSALRSLVAYAALEGLYGDPHAVQEWFLGPWSPDGRQLTLEVDGHNYFIVAAVNADGSGLHRITAPNGRSTGATWSPDGNRIAATNEVNILQIMDADGSHMRTVEIRGGTPFLFAAWNPVPGP